MAVALNAVASRGGGTAESFMEMAKNAAQEYFEDESEDDD
jgi:predicted RNase H-like HicB family nuclease